MKLHLQRRTPPRRPRIALTGAPGPWTPALAGAVAYLVGLAGLAFVLGVVAGAEWERVAWIVSAVSWFCAAAAALETKHRLDRIWSCQAQVAEPETGRSRPCRRRACQIDVRRGMLVCRDHADGRRAP